MSVVAMKRKRYLTMRMVTERLALSRGTINRWVKAGKFPRPHKFGCSIRWQETDVDLYEAEAAAGRAWSPETTLERSLSR